MSDDLGLSSDYRVLHTTDEATLGSPVNEPTPTGVNYSVSQKK